MHDLICKKISAKVSPKVIELMNTFNKYSGDNISLQIQLCFHTITENQLKKKFWKPITIASERKIEG
jgi:hypothetical protein